MTQASEYRRNFTVTFRSLALRAFTRPPQPIMVLPRESRVVRRVPALAQASLSDRVAAAFTELPARGTEIKVVAALLHHPNSTSEELSALCGWTRACWQTHFGALCQRRAAYLWPAEPACAADATFLAGELANYCPHRRIFAFKPEVDQALRVLEVDWQV